MAWQLQEAKQKFSEVVRRAVEEGPQTVTKHGEEVVVVVSMAEWQESRIRPDKPDFVDFILDGPDFTGVDLSRSKDTGRKIDFP